MTLPAELRSLVEFHPTWRTRQKFFVLEENWSRVRPYYDTFKLYVSQEVSFNMLGHTTRDVDGVRFGSDTPAVSAQLLEYFDPVVVVDGDDVEGVTDVRVGVEVQETRKLHVEAETPTDLTASQTWRLRRNLPPPKLPKTRTRAPPWRPRESKYVFEKLAKVGDHFLVTDVDLRVVSNTVTVRHRSDTRRYRCLQVRRGVLVVLVELSSHTTYDIEV